MKQADPSLYDSRSKNHRAGFLGGKTRIRFEVIRQMIIEDVGPRTILEWLWTMDLVELSWEILRYRRLREDTSRIPRQDARNSYRQSKALSCSIDPL